MRLAPDLPRGPKRPFHCRDPLLIPPVEHAGSFKTRGAFTNLLSGTIPAAGVVAASGGNHGAAVAYAAMRPGVPAHIFVPTVSVPAKIARIRGYGAQLVVGGDLYADAGGQPGVDGGVGRAAYFSDECHLTKLAHRTLAEALASELSRGAILPDDSPLAIRR